jgi:hypothetical protein
MVAEQKPSANGARAKRAPKRAVAPERDRFEQMFDSLAKVAENARAANAAHLALEAAAHPSGQQGTSRWWPLPMRRRDRNR